MVFMVLFGFDFAFDFSLTRLCLFFRGSGDIKMLLGVYVIRK